MSIKTEDLSKNHDFQLIEEGNNLQKDITSVYCCDLLSLVMGRAPADSAWVTVMGNVNALAVAVLADISCIVLAEGMNLDETAQAKAKQKGITVFRTELPVYEASCQIGAMIHE